jgi:hypothetical protein
MENIVKTYLKNNYYINTSQIGNDGIYKINDDPLENGPMYGEKLLDELIAIFHLDKIILKEYVNNWAISTKENVDLTFYWKTIEEIIGVPRILGGLMRHAQNNR